MESVTEIRNRIREDRRAVDPQLRAANSSKICQRFLKLDSFKSADCIAAYLAFDGEADPMELMISAVDSGKRVFLPIIVGKSKPLSFAPWTPSTKMVNNRFNILEPDVDPAQWLPATELDFVVNPLVGFDEQCNRIGVGGGYYDRTFAFLNEPDAVKKVILVGFAFELQRLPSVQPQSWDVQLDSVVTQSHVYR